MTARPKNTVEHWARVRREVVLHRMATAKCLDSKLFWAIILWSWCGPEISDAVVLKDAKGYIRKDNNGNPIPAKLKDLRELLGLREGMKSEVTRAAQGLEEVGSIRFDRKNSSSRDCGVMYPVHEPPTVNPSLVVGTRNQNQWCIGRMVVGTRNLPTDPVARTKAIEWLEETGTAWKSDLKTLRTRYRDMLVQAAPALGIIYVLEEKNRREDPPPPLTPPPTNNPDEKAAAAAPLPVEVLPALREPAAVGPTDLPPTYATFKSLYPNQRFDEHNTKPLLKAASPDRLRYLIQRLCEYLMCENWRQAIAEDQTRFIPLASTWIKKHADCDPPPVFHNPDSGLRKLRETADSIQRVAAMSGAMGRES